MLATDLSAPKEATTGNHKEALWHVRKYFEIKAAQSVEVDTKGQLIFILSLKIYILAGSN